MPAPDSPTPTGAEPADDLLVGLAAPTPADRAGALLADLGLSPRSAAAVAAAVLVALGAWWWLRAPATTSAEASLPRSPAASAIPAASTVPGAGATATAPEAPTGEVVAHAAGAVVRPGLYRLPAGARIDDLLRAAGGAGPRADLDRVNLAALVVDGSQVLVPRIGEPVPTVAGTPGGTTGTPGEPTAAGPVDLNTADAAALETLPGVGPATAAAILEYREANGGFATVDELIDVPGIGEAKLAAVRDLVTV